jgi:glutathione S-transferase
MMCFPVQASVSRSGLAGDFPNVRAYVARIEERPAWARAIERGGEHIIAG